MARKGQVKRWHEDDDLYIRDNYKVITNAQIAIVLERTEDAVTNRVYHLGLEGQHKNPSRKEYDAIEADAAREMGCGDYYEMTGELPGCK